MSMFAIQEMNEADRADRELNPSPKLKGKTNSSRCDYGPQERCAGSCIANVNRCFVNSLPYTRSNVDVQAVKRVAFDDLWGSGAILW